MAKARRVNSVIKRCPFCRSEFKTPHPKEEHYKCEMCGRCPHCYWGKINLQCPTTIRRCPFCLYPCGNSLYDISSHNICPKCKECIGCRFENGTLEEVIDMLKTGNINATDEVLSVDL